MWTFQHGFTGKFLSTLSLRRATWLRCWKLAARDISIHALLAESDNTVVKENTAAITISIHALLAESDIVSCNYFPFDIAISIHALLAESDRRRLWLLAQTVSFLSTLSLRRAT